VRRAEQQQNALESIDLKCDVGINVISASKPQLMKESSAIDVTDEGTENEVMDRLEISFSAIVVTARRAETEGDDFRIRSVNRPIGLLSIFHYYLG
jgi:hypothetical protein